ncbi:TIR domain-containing protein [Rhodococcus hoagii]|nr:TIR domain-containing protein [Prescottella equi]NKW34410.1 TIR domain-containing protein [Prescottella equi]
MSSSPEPAPPRAFMSYSQDDTAHMGWVQQLAARLVRDGVDVTLDQWDLKAGLNLNLFMESGLTESDRVLVVSSSNYVTKANGRTGGAGFEGNILSADMFNGGLHKDRIIPVIRNNPGGTVPTFLAGPCTSTCATIAITKRSTKTSSERSMASRRPPSRS